MIRTDYPKIDLYVRQPDGGYRYAATTTWSRTLKQARKAFKTAQGLGAGDIVKAHYQEPRRKHSTHRRTR
jgi:hypothetical protein